MKKISKAKLLEVSKDRPRNYLRTIKKYTVKEDETHIYMEQHHFNRLVIKYRKKYIPFWQRIELTILVLIGYLTFFPLLALRSETHKGLGDTAEVVIQKVIGQRMSKRMRRRGCGCGRRQRILNAVFPYKKKSTINSSVNVAA